MSKRRKRKETRTPRYRVDVALKAQDLPKAGYAVKFTVENPQGLIGTVEIGQGSLRWKRSHKHKFRRLSWDSFFDRLQRT